MAYLRYREVSHDRVVAANFEMTQAQFVLLVFQGALHRPARESDMQDDFQRRARLGVAKEVFFFLRIENIARVDEPVGAENLASALQPKRSPLDFPDRRAFFGVLDVDALPRLTHHGLRVAAQGFDIAVDGTRFAAWIAQPTVKVAADFADETLLQGFEPSQKVGTTGVPFVEGEPSEVDAVGQRVAELFEGDFILGSVGNVIGNGCFLASLRIVPGVLGKKQRAVEHGAETRIEAGVAEVNADNAVIDLAGVAAPLPLHAGGFLAGLGMT